MAFNFIRIRITIFLKGNSSDPYAFFGIKGMALQDAVRQAIHCSCSSCDYCKKKECPFSVGFSQTLSTDPAALRRYQKPSLPFVFDVPVLPPAPNKGSLCYVFLTLVGSAVLHCPVYLTALRILFTKGSLRYLAEVIKTETTGYDDTTYETGTDGTNGFVILSDQGLLESRSLPTSEIAIEFLSPLRLLQQGGPVRVLAPSLLLRSLMRRISSLAYYFGGVELEADFKWLSDRAALISWKDASFRWVSWDRSISGLLGGGVLVGDLTEFHYFLQLGEYFNVGKGAAYGLGNFTLGEKR